MVQVLRRFVVEALENCRWLRLKKCDFVGSVVVVVD